MLNSLSFCLSVKLLISPSYLKEILAGYSNLHCRQTLYCLSHQGSPLIKLTKIKHKEQILKEAKKKQQITHKGIPIRITADLSFQARREWQDILQVMKEKNLQPRLLYLARISFKCEGEIKSFTDKQKPREISTTKPAHQQMLKDLL